MSHSSPEHPSSGLPRAEYFALQRPSVERRVLGFAGEFAGLDPPDAVGVEQAQIGGRALGQPAALGPKQSGGTGGQQVDGLGERDRAVMDLRQGNAEQGGEAGAARGRDGIGEARVVGVPRLMDIAWGCRLLVPC